MNVRATASLILAAAGGVEATRRLQQLLAATASRPWLSRKPRRAPGRVAVVVPARDEAGSIRACVAALLAQDPSPVGVVVVDDGSADGTQLLAAAAGAGDERLAVESLQDARPGAGGKPAACQLGAEVAVRRFAPDWICFVDADVRLAPSAVACLVGAASDRGVEAASLIGRLEGGDLGCRLLLPDVGLAVITGEGNPAHVNSDDHPAVVASGQCLAIRTDAYFAVGGHESVADEVLEDCVLAARLVEAGYRHRLFLGQALMQVRMYERFPELWQGLAKNMAGMRGSRGRDVVVELWRLLAPTWLPLAALALDARGPGGRLARRVLEVVWHTRMGMRIVSAQNPELAVLAPVSDAVHAALYVDSVRRWHKGSVRWKGRRIPVVGGGPSRARARLERRAA